MVPHNQILRRELQKHAAIKDTVLAAQMKLLNGDLLDSSGSLTISVTLSWKDDTIEKKSFDIGNAIDEYGRLDDETPFSHLSDTVLTQYMGMIGEIRTQLEEYRRIIDGLEQANTGYFQPILDSDSEVLKAKSDTSIS
jgi:hypothetical protein